MKDVKFQEQAHRQENNSTSGCCTQRRHRCDSGAACSSEDTHCIVRMEDVGGGGVVHNDDLIQVTTQTTQVLDVVTPVKDAGLPEEAAAEGPPLVQEVRDGVCILSGDFFK